MNQVAAYPAYVRLVLKADEKGAVRACRLFARLCQEEGGKRALILAQPPARGDDELDEQIGLAARGLQPGFKLAIVAQGRHAGSVLRVAALTAARLSGKVVAFRSEHQAAAWLMS